MEHGAVPDSTARHNRKKLTIIASSSILLIAMVAAIAVGLSSRKSTSPSPTSTAELHSSVKALCSPTDFQDTCEQALTDAGGDSISDPKELIKLAFNVTIAHIAKSLKNSSVLAEAEKDPRTSKALHNCAELLDYAIDDLRTLFAQFGDINFSEVDDVIDDLRVWLSSAMTYHETCLDGFENTTGSASEKMKKALKSSMELTTNALAIVDDISSVLVAFKLPMFSRRLLSTEEEEELPAWVNTGRRRLLSASRIELQPDVVVAQDGSGNFTSINEALEIIPKKSNLTFVIHIKEGVYKENVMVNKSMMNVMMVGDGPTKTKITGNLNFIDGTPTFKTATLAVVGKRFIGKDLWIENSAGPEKHQAVALRVQSDMSVFYNCRMDGYQDTLYVHTNRQFYRNCTITGTIDFIFGNSATVFQNCLILVRRPMSNQQNIVTAQGRKGRREPTAIIIHNSTITAEPDFYPHRIETRNYLGRPWKEYSRTFILQTYIDDLIHSDGWLPWSGDFGLRTCFYTEFDNRGPGAETTKRVKWRGVKKINYQHAQKFTVERFIRGNQWVRATGVPYIPGLLPVNEGGRTH
ncbi:LOW QUALITY PROTEIN: putative pectinesterase/pectinesterase inhibitor 28 [Dioscorea cayenensis subsp. rotundata]|uniref:Pectinesterase n=1 Tax=Dioscorea cayennensis subsp. rotundata TaxID=55577 RepID=A0AB40BJT3_DIOCR|nr:LOW QUALITY PROTEIN: putative pectinesterase/pectinesterase inhibitor 28 [Dioscorea cayenensis subsp. rotundata]